VAGAGFLVTVTTEAVAVLCSGVAIAEGRAWPATVAAALLAIGITGYPLVLRDFDLGQVLHGHGDQWVVGGAPAIDALSAGVLVLASESTHALGGLRGAFSVAGLVMLVIALAWLPALVAGEIARPRPGFHSPRWATVFPLGMYAAAAFVVGSAAGHAWMTGFARVWVWIAFAAWAVVGAAGVRRAVALLRRGGPPVP
jgi:hypothetical protein